MQNKCMGGSVYQTKKQIRITLTTKCHQKSNNRNIHHISQIINFELPDTRSNLYIEKKKTIK